MNPSSETHAAPSAKRPASWYESMYNNRLRVPDFTDHLVRWQLGSARVRSQGHCELNLAYGPAPSDTLDVFLPSATTAGTGARKNRGSPVLVFIHGGYWHALDKGDHSFVAETLSQLGVCTVVLNYALCPGTPEAPVRISDIALQCARCLAWVYRHIGEYGGDPNQIVVAGHSAGGHLAAALLACDFSRLAADLPRQFLRSAVSISGLFDLEPLRLTPFLKAPLQLSPQEVARMSPVRWPAPKLRTDQQLWCVVGGDESAEFLRQNRLLQIHWGPSRVPVAEALAGHNHFSIMSEGWGPKGVVLPFVLNALGMTGN